MAIFLFCIVNARTDDQRSQHREWAFVAFLSFYAELIFMKKSRLNREFFNRLHSYMVEMPSVIT
jgi:hypothetical protein